MKRSTQRSIFVFAMVSLAVFVPAVFAKKAAPPPDGGAGPSPASNVDPAKAELSATVAMASIKCGRLALAEDASLADVKDTVSGIYDRQEAATKSALDKLHAASDAKSKADAVAAVNAADDEAASYFKKNPTVHDK